MSKKLSKKERRLAKGMKGLPHSGWITEIDEIDPGHKPKASKQRSLFGSEVADIEIFELNPKMREYRQARKEGKSIWI